MKAEDWMNTNRRLRKSDLNEKLVCQITDDLFNARDTENLYLFNWIVDTALYNEEIFNKFFDILNPFVDEMERIYEAFSWYNIKCGREPLPKVNKPTMQDMPLLLMYVIKNDKEGFNREFNRILYK